MSLVTQLYGGRLGDWCASNLPNAGELAQHVARRAAGTQPVRPPKRQELNYYSAVGSMFGQRLAWLVEPSPPYAALLGAIRNGVLTHHGANLATAAYISHLAINGPAHGLLERPTPRGWWRLAPEQPPLDTGDETLDSMAGFVETSEALLSIKPGHFGSDLAELELLPHLANIASYEHAYRSADGRTLDGEIDGAILTNDWLGMIEKNRTGLALRVARGLVTRPAGTTPLAWGHASPTIVHRWAEGDVLLGPGHDGGYTLLDCKTVTRADETDRVIVWLWQTLLYALLDTTDRWQIRRIGLWLTRHGIVLHWPVDDALATMAGIGKWGREKKLAALRADLLTQARRAIAEDGGEPPAEWSA